MNKPDLARARKAIEMGQIDEALSILEPIVRHSYDDPDPLVYLGIAYVQAEKPQAAVSVLEDAKELVEDHPVIELFLGRALMALGRYEEAE